MRATHCNGCWSDEYERITRWHVSQFAYLASKLDSMPEGDGTVSDNSCLMFLSNLWIGRTHDNSSQHSPAEKTGPGDMSRAGRAALPPNSPIIKEALWAPPETIVRKARGSDNWPLTWADDDALYAAYGDGNGFEPFIAAKLSMGFARITDEPPDLLGRILRSSTGETTGQGAAGKKASGMLMVNGLLYLWARNAANSQLAWSRDHGATWTWADWKFASSFGCPTFLNFGRNYTGARDDYQVDAKAQSFANSGAVECK